MSPYIIFSFGCWINKQKNPPPPGGGQKTPQTVSGSAVFPLRFPLLPEIVPEENLIRRLAGGGGLLFLHDLGVETIEGARVAHGEEGPDAEGLGDVEVRQRLLLVPARHGVGGEPQGAALDEEVLDGEAQIQQVALLAVALGLLLGVAQDDHL